MKMIISQQYIYMYATDFVFFCLAWELKLMRRYQLIKVLTRGVRWDGLIKGII
jgi:hypothetical protein